MSEPKVYRICTTCRIHHYENCESCFGFGVYPDSRQHDFEDNLVPINAGAAHDGTSPSNWVPCPECGSTPTGLPTETAL